MTYFIFKPSNNRFPQAGFEIGLGRGTNSSDETWYLGRYDELAVDPAALAAIGCEYKVIGTDPDAEVKVAAPWLLENKEVEIRAKGATELLAVGGQYWENERESWTKQETQALAYQADPTIDISNITLLYRMATKRGVDIAVLAQGVLDNANLYEEKCGDILGIQQGLLDTLYSTDLPLVTALTLAWPEA